MSLRVVLVRRNEFVYVFTSYGCFCLFCQAFSSQSGANQTQDNVEKQNAIVLVKILNQKPRYKATAGQLRNRKVYALGLSKVINSLERDKELVPQCAKADSKESAFKGVNDRTNKKKGVDKVRNPILII